MSMQVASKPGAPELLQQLVEMVRNPSSGLAALSSATVGKEDKARQPRDKKVTGSSLVVCIALFISILIFCSDLKSLS